MGTILLVLLLFWQVGNRPPVAVWDTTPVPHWSCGRGTMAAHASYSKNDQPPNCIQPTSKAVRALEDPNTFELIYFQSETTTNIPKGITHAQCGAVPGQTLFNCQGFVRRR